MDPGDRSHVILVLAVFLRCGRGRGCRRLGLRLRGLGPWAAVWARGPDVSQDFALVAVHGLGGAVRRGMAVWPEDARASGAATLAPAFPARHLAFVSRIKLLSYFIRSFKCIWSPNYLGVLGLCLFFPAVSMLRMR